MVEALSKVTSLSVSPKTTNVERYTDLTAQQPAHNNHSTDTDDPLDNGTYPLDIFDSPVNYSKPGAIHRC